MISMTGFGYGSSKNDAFSLEVEIKSYNNRFLELNRNLNYTLSIFEPYIDSEIKKVCKRGHIEITVRLKVIEQDVTVNVDEAVVKEYMDAFERVGSLSNLKPSFSDLISRDGVLTLIKNDSSEKYKDALEEALGAALEQLKEAKEREGDATREDLYKMGKRFEEAVETIASYSSDLEMVFREQFSERLKELKGDLDITEDRFNQEVALLVVKYTINEEIKRLRVHIKEFFNLLDSSDAVGKRIDFLAQEMIRETNTIASKSFLSEISSMTISMKDSVENIREQVRNIE